MINRDDALLLIIDIQDVLMPSAETVTTKFIDGVRKLTTCLKLLDLPVLVAEQNPTKLGGTTSAISRCIEGITPFPKMAFSCLADDKIREAIENTGRRQLIIAGMETHICVMQTALDALENGYAPAVVRNAVCAREKREHEAGLYRLAQAGVTMSTVEMTIFELLRSAGTDAFKEMLPWLK